MSADFQRIAIVNRGEPAMRLIHAIREFNLERGTGIAAIALFTEPDRRARFVREADESYNLGPATFVDDADGQRKPTYLDYERLERALRRGPGRRGHGRGGDSSPSGPTSSSSATGWGSRSSARAATRSGVSATRSRPSGSPNRRACR